MKKPKIGDKIYVPTSLYVYRGIDDFIGGIATISKIKYSGHLPEDHINYMFIGIKEADKGVTYNHKVLLGNQKKLKREFGSNFAHADPDTREEFNQPDADWETH